MNDGKVSAARQRAIEEFATWEVIFLGGDKGTGKASWDVKDAVGTNHVTAELASTRRICDCQGFVTGGGQACIHIELVRESRARAEAAQRPAPPPVTAPPAADPPAPALVPVTLPGPPATVTPLAAAASVGELAAIRAALEGLVRLAGELALAGARQATALEALARYSAPKAPNYRRTLAEWAAFDWEAIDAEVVARDHDGVAAVRWGGFVWTRRAPENKFGEAVWYSRPDGKAEDGAVRYARLITFSKPAVAEPVSRKVTRETA